MRVDIRTGKQWWILDSDRETVVLSDGVEINQCTFREFGNLLNKLKGEGV